MSLWGSVMAHKRGNGGRPEIREDQLHDYQLTSERLRQINFDAAQLVIALARMYTDAEQYRCLCQNLRASVLQMKLCVEACEAMAGGGFDPPNVRVEYVLVPRHECGGRTGAGKCAEDEKESAPTFELDPTWSAEVDALMRLTRMAVNWLGGSAASSERTVQAPLACLGALSRVLARQRRHVSAMSISSTEVTWEEAQTCPNCGLELSGSTWTDSQHCGANLSSTQPKD